MKLSLETHKEGNIWGEHLRQASKTKHTQTPTTLPPRSPPKQPKKHKPNKQLQYFYFFKTNQNPFTTVTRQVVMTFYTGSVFVELDNSAVVATSGVHRGQLGLNTAKFAPVLP